MNKLLTTLALALSLLFGGTVALAGPATANDCQSGTCEPTPEPCNRTGGCTPPVVACPVSGGCDVSGFVRLLDQLHETETSVVTAEQTANDYRAQVVALTAQLAESDAAVARLQTRTDRQAATIQRLRAKIRSLR